MDSAFEFKKEVWKRLFWAFGVGEKRVAGAFFSFKKERTTFVGYVCYTKKSSKKMSVTIQLPSTVEHHLRKDATQNGLTLEKYLVRLLTEKGMARPTKKNGQRRSETELLGLVALNVQPADLEEFYRLAALFEAETISEQEREKLLEFNELIEIAHAERLKHVLELAELRNTSLEKTMDDLGIKRHLA